MNLLFEPDDLVQIRLLPSKASRFARVSELHVLDPYLAEQNAAGQNIYVGANSRLREGGKTSDVSHARCLFVDIDHATVQEALRRVHEARLPTVITSAFSIDQLEEAKPRVGSRLMDMNVVDWQPITAHNYRDQRRA